MINQLNLANRPFRNRTLPWLIAALITAVSLFGYILIFAELRAVEVRAEEARRNLLEVEPQVQQLKAESEEIKSELTNEQKNSLAHAHLLVARKRFAWSRLFADLENNLPREVSVSHVSVRDVYQKNDVTQAELDFAVLSKNYQAVMNMIAGMNQSGVFQAELRGQDLQKNKGNLTEYTLRLFYLPRAGQTAESGDAQTTARNQPGTEVTQ